MCVGSSRVCCGCCCAARRLRGQSWILPEPVALLVFAVLFLALGAKPDPPRAPGFAAFAPSASWLAAPLASSLPTAARLKAFLRTRGPCASKRSLNARRLRRRGPSATVGLPHAGMAVVPFPPERAAGKTRRARRPARALHRHPAGPGGSRAPEDDGRAAGAEAQGARERSLTERLAGPTAPRTASTLWK